jgi:glycosyltransferase involved in cell wall biosynthesis
MERELLAQNEVPGIGKLLKSAARTAFFSPSPPPKPPPSRMISVVIPAHNEAGYLPQTLDALQLQNYGWYEVIVVANGCSDRTPEVARSLCHRLIVLSQKSLGIARNLGARMAKGEILVFLDADTILEPMTLRVIAEQFAQGFATGTIRGRPDSPDPRYRILYGAKNMLHKLCLHPGSSGVIICWKDDFVRAGGFDENLEVRENSHLMKRLLRFGRYKFIGDVSAVTSMRRYEQQGFRKLTWLWVTLWSGLFSATCVHRRYEPVGRFARGAPYRLRDLERRPNFAPTDSLCSIAALEAELARVPSLPKRKVLKWMGK